MYMAVGVSLLYIKMHAYSSERAFSSKHYAINYTTEHRHPLADRGKGCVQPHF